MCIGLFEQAHGLISKIPTIPPVEEAIHADAVIYIYVYIYKYVRTNQKINCRFHAWASIFWCIYNANMLNLLKFVYIYMYWQKNAHISVYLVISTYIYIYICILYIYIYSWQLEIDAEAQNGLVSTRWICLNYVFGQMWAGTTPWSMWMK